MKRPPFTTVGALGVAAGCAGMAAMLPGAAAGLLGAIGISASSALARTLSPIAEPLFIVSAVLVILGALACGRVVALLSVTGTVLLYLSMFQLASGRSTSGGSMSMTTMQPRHHGSLHAEPVSFYLGLALLLSAFAVSFWRRRRHQCKPLFRLREPLGLEG
jgi:hypothetical protein